MHFFMSTDSTQLGYVKQTKKIICSFSFNIMDVEFILSDPIKRRVWNEHWCKC